nr:putative ribonuclease H-like domain-containing protein [Tanacetum cinerariifolium]
MAKAKENALSVEIQIISSENVRNYQDIKIKRHLLENFGVIATKMKRRRQRTKSVLWLKLPMRHQVTPKECHLHAVKMIFRYLKGHPKLRLWYPKESPFDLVAYSNSDYGGATQDRKSTTGGCQFLDGWLISWQCKKQTIVATSTTEAEYVTAASCCGQVL